MLSALGEALVQIVGNKSKSSETIASKNKNRHIVDEDDEVMNDFILAGDVSICQM